MDLQYEPIRRLLANVRGRYRSVAMCRAIVRAALVASAIITAALAAAPAVSSPFVLVAIAAVVIVAAAVAAGWAFLPLRARPSDAQVARFVEERVPSLDDRLATAEGAGRSRRPRLDAPRATRAGALGGRRPADVRHQNLPRRTAGTRPPAPLLTPC